MTETQLVGGRVYRCISLPDFLFALIRLVTEYEKQEKNTFESSGKCSLDKGKRDVLMFCLINPGDLTHPCDLALNPISNKLGDPAKSVHVSGPQFSLIYKMGIITSRPLRLV